MENDKFQELVLKHLAHMSEDIHMLKGDVSSLKDDYSSLKGDVSSLTSDFSSLKGDVSSLKGDFSSVKSDVSFLKGVVGRIETRMENEVIDKIGALFDGFKLHVEKLDRLEHKVDAVFELAGVHEVQIKLIKGNIT